MTEVANARTPLASLKISPELINDEEAFKSSPPLSSSAAEALRDDGRKQTAAPLSAGKPPGAGAPQLAGDHQIIEGVGAAFKKVRRTPDLFAGTGRTRMQ